MYRLVSVWMLMALVRLPLMAEVARWNGEVHLSNGHLKLRVVPVIGRISHLSRVGGPNVLRQDPEKIGVTDVPTGRWDWNNPGGDWLWPVSQDQWASLGVERRWPPPAVFEYAPWSATLRSRADGAPEILMVQELGEPLHVRLTRRIWFCPEEGRTLLVEQTMTRTAPSEIVVCLWQIAQIPQATRAELRVPENTRHESGWHHIQGAVPPSESLRLNEGWLSVDVAGAKGGKLGTDGTEITGTGTGGTLRIRMEAVEGKGELPDGGCSLTLAIVRDGAYAELETLSPERVLQPGEVIRNLLIYSLEGSEADGE